MKINDDDSVERDQKLRISSRNKEEDELKGRDDEPKPNATVS